MRTASQITALLPELDDSIADVLEDQDLDFKQWDAQSREKAVQTLVRMAVCMANGGGGTVVFGVADQIVGRALLWDKKVDLAEQKAIAESREANRSYPYDVNSEPR